MENFDPVYDPKVLMELQKDNFLIEEIGKTLLGILIKEMKRYKSYLLSLRKKKSSYSRK